jgi:hypothetical protein
MAVIGDQEVYFSHLPMFSMPEHAYQVLLQAVLEGHSGPQAAYLEDRREHPNQGLYTFAPTVAFVLPDLFPNGTDGAELTTFRGDLFRGHFERSDTNPVRIAGDVTVRVTRIVHHHRFEADTGDLGELQYFLFGKGSELLLSHRINHAPDHDHLLSADVDPRFSDEELSTGIVLKFTGRPNTVAARIKPGSDAELPAVAEVAGETRAVRVRPKTQYYFETDDLRDGM